MFFFAYFAILHAKIAHASRAITLHGFKSFSEKTTVKVLPGITAIVGPNGCGKSNISEAVRWALGEQSAKSLRGQRMEDLIFHGSASRKPVGLAEVELTFANDGTLSVPWSEIGVARRLYRTGESEYLLNRQPARAARHPRSLRGNRREPARLLGDGPGQAQSRPHRQAHERRVFIEEAAGIARCKQQRNETQGKLDAARQNLVRVRDVMDEVRRQLGSLERQARKAQQYKALQTEKRELGLALMAADFAALTTRNDALAAQLTRLRDAEQGARARLTGLAAREAQHRELLQESEHRLGDLRQSVQKIQGELERLLERREQMGVQLHELGEEARRLEDEAFIATERLGTIVGEREAARTALGEAERFGAERSASVLALEIETERHRVGLAGERDRLEALRLEQSARGGRTRGPDATGRRAARAPGAAGPAIGATGSGAGRGRGRGRAAHGRAGHARIGARARQCPRCPCWPPSVRSWC